MSFAQSQQAYLIQPPALHEEWPIMPNSLDPILPSLWRIWTFFWTISHESLAILCTVLSLVKRAVTSKRAVSPSLICLIPTSLSIPLLQSPPGLREFHMILLKSVPPVIAKTSSVSDQTAVLYVLVESVDCM